MRRWLRIALTIAFGLVIVPSYLRAFKLATPSAAPSINIGDSILVNGRMLPLQALNRADFNWVAPVNHIGSEVYNEDGHWISFTPGKGECRNHAPVSLSEHQYFVVGDNRDGSLDSRIWGPVGEERILGKVMITYARSK
jgi:hypothetical protein